MRSVPQPCLRLLLPMLVAAVTAAAFLPALGNGFVWDDERNFLGNPWYRGLGSAQLGWMFTSFHMGHYIPLTWVSLGFDYVLWGMNPFGYHLTNVLLHALNAALAYGLAIRLLARTTPGEPAWRVHAAAALAALLFAIHPLRVESVAWVTERRDVLSGTFYLLAVLAYLRAAATTRARWYWTSVGLFGLAVLAKSMAVTLTVVLVVLDVYPLGRLGGGDGRWVGRTVWRVWAEKVPFALLSAVASVLAFVAISPVANVLSVRDLAWGERLALVAHSYGFYLWKLAVPLGLSPIYELRPIDVSEWPFVLGIAAVAAISLSAFALRRRAPGLAAAWLAYAVIVLPVSGIAQNGPQIAADRYTYLASLPWALLAAGGALRTLRAMPRPVLATGVAVVVLLGALTWKQALVWRNDHTLWTHAAATSTSAVAHTNLGGALALRGDWAKAMHHAYAALRIAPGLAKPYFILGHGALRVDRVDEALAHFSEAVRLDPTFAEAHNSRGVLLARLDRWDEAHRHFRKAVELRRHYPNAEHNLVIARERLAHPGARVHRPQLDD